MLYRRACVIQAKVRHREILIVCYQREYKYLLIFLVKMSGRIELESVLPVWVVHVDSVGVDNHIGLNFMLITNAATVVWK
jgi:hypothetical protein